MHHALIFGRHHHWLGGGGGCMVAGCVGLACLLACSCFVPAACALLIVVLLPARSALAALLAAGLAATRRWARGGGL